jgi:FAD/FMN-containing dehydrogenase
MRERNRRLYEKARDVGGCLYPVGTLPLDRAGWVAHYADAWTRFRQAKTTYDPAGILTPGPRIF